MKIGELIQRVQSLYSKGVQSDDSRLMSRHIYNKLLSARDRILFELIRNNIQISKDWYVFFDCLDIIEADLSECPCYGNDCSIFRSKCKLPDIFVIDNRKLIYSVVSIDGSQWINRTTFEKVKLLQYNKYTSKEKYYWIKDDYIYFINIGRMEKFRIGLIPKDIVKFYIDDCIGNKCINIYDLEFPIDSSFIDQLIQYALQELLDIFIKNKQDLSQDTNDENDNPKTEVTR